MFDKLVLVTRKTRLQGLVERFNTRAQAKFYLEHAGLDFDDYAKEDDTYRAAIDRLEASLKLGLAVQRLDRALLSTYHFGPGDLVVAAGQDGLVANTAKYVGAQPLLGVNPDPSRFDGTLLPFSVPGARAAVIRTLEGKAALSEVTLARAQTSDGQTLLAFNDLFIGEASHQSAHYRLWVSGGDAQPSKKAKAVKTPASAPERQSSSGVIVSTGAGSTGWLSSICTMAARVGAFLGGPHAVEPVRMAWDDSRLFFVVREPFVSRHSQASRVVGFLERGSQLHVESLMPQSGTIFSDGMEADALRFTSGMTVRIGPAPQRARLVVTEAHLRQGTSEVDSFTGRIRRKLESPGAGPADFPCHVDGALRVR
ncbi:MAG: NAD+ kinase [Myxococcaceae bacterium]|nr:NAD+ kinase [Myxococcaceae bacterium]